MALRTLCRIETPLNGRRGEATVRPSSMLCTGRVLDTGMNYSQTDYKSNRNTHSETLPLLLLLLQT